MALIAHTSCLLSASPELHTPNQATIPRTFPDAATPRRPGIAEQPNLTFFDRLTPRPPRIGLQPPPPPLRKKSAATASRIPAAVNAGVAGRRTNRGRRAATCQDASAAVPRPSPRARVGSGAPSLLWPRRRGSRSTSALGTGRRPDRQDVGERTSGPAERRCGRPRGYAQSACGRWRVVLRQRLHSSGPGHVRPTARRPHPAVRRRRRRIRHDVCHDRSPGAESLLCGMGEPRSDSHLILKRRNCRCGCRKISHVARRCRSAWWDTYEMIERGRWGG